MAVIALDLGVLPGLEDDALTCIESMQRDNTITFTYGDKHREVEVHALGRTSNGDIVMRGFQVGGEASRPLPQWTLFSLAKAEGVAHTDTVSLAPREGYVQGDKQMQRPIIAELLL